ncbi:phosphate-starvation-inducible PsiE family protein [Draconibacterium sp. IB214405]|uniref:phosphate-starvation-inducible PsiE family protein n=1 Tax=Draconibacterium sp. IB214405 TaxID=3097352 RepID=UPI002A101CB0|nr:phosphate-starvation-inducible PsiE family protein [Draconibacterium sp. IB214405]MDX8341107.1 phosphate-starvation-inducible PsiE family protein [Draconibacterium sp. IB214405]
MNVFQKIINIAERIIIIILIVFMVIVLIISAVEVGIVIIHELTNPNMSNGAIINIDGLLDIFGFFLTVLIGLELFETVKLYLKENVFHGEVILLVSLIAVARKVIVLDYSKEEPLTIIAISALVAAISLGYYLIKKTIRQDKGNN